MMRLATAHIPRTRRLALGCVLFAALSAGCVSTPAPPGMQVDAQRVATVVPGQSTRDSVRSSLGATKAIAFDTGYQTWLYQVARGGGRHAEFVVLFDPAGVVRKTRTREPLPSDPPR